jgi:predicted DNA-binding transcriptional regulator YafY
MSNLHRLRWIDNQVRLKLHPNCTKIAEEFEISIRQASRDIEYLKYSLNAPLIYSKSENGYYYKDLKFMLPSLFNTGEEKDTIQNLAEQYKNLGSQQARAMTTLFEKISIEDIYQKPDLRGNTPLSIPLNQVQNYQRISEGIKQNNKIEMEYTIGLSKKYRIIHPYEWIQRFGFYYVVGYCEKKKKIRLFRLDRVFQTKLLSESFVVADDYKKERYQKEIVFNHREPFKAIVMLDQTDEKKEFFFYDSNQILGSLISNPDSYRIIKPIWLLLILQNKVEKLLGRRIAWK